MPAFTAVKEATQNALSEPGSSTYQEAQTRVAQSASLNEAVVNGGFLDLLPAEHQPEVRAVLNAMPPAVDGAFLASLRDALQNNKRVAFGWRERNDFAHETTTEPDGTVKLWLECPPGDTFT